MDKEWDHFVGNIWEWETARTLISGIELFNVGVYHELLFTQGYRALTEVTVTSSPRDEVSPHAEEAVAN